MTTISFVSTHPMVAEGDRSLTTIALFCCCGLIISFSMLMSGVSLAPDWV